MAQRRASSGRKPDRSARPARNSLTAPPDPRSGPLLRTLVEPTGSEPAGVPTSVSQPGVVASEAPSAGWTRPQRAYVRWVKPAFDRGAALVLLVGSAPLMAAVALTVRVSLGPGVIFRQERVGRGGRLFTVYKFRTLRPSRRGTLSALPVTVDRRLTHKHPGDPRLTPAGAFLRTFSLDELPQLFNVLSGDMSVVGPRPEMPGIVASYDPWQHGRLEVRPGLTGPWQVSARGLRAMHDCVDLDIEYVRSVSIGTDLQLLLRTPLAMLGAHRGH